MASCSASVMARPRQDVSTRSARSKRCCSQATATTSTRRPDSRSICQSGWWAAPQECSSVGVSHAGVDVGEYRAVLLDRHRHLDVEIADAAMGAPVVDSFRQQLGVDPELGEAGDLLLLGGQPGQVRMVQHEVERQEPPAHNFNGSLPAVADIVKAQFPVDGLAEDPVDSAGVYGLGHRLPASRKRGLREVLERNAAPSSGSIAGKPRPGLG